MGEAEVGQDLLEGVISDVSPVEHRASGLREQRRTEPWEAQPSGVNAKRGFRFVAGIDDFEEKRQGLLDVAAVERLVAMEFRQEFGSDVVLDMGGEVAGLAFAEIEPKRIAAIRAQLPSLANRQKMPNSLTS